MQYPDTIRLHIYVCVSFLLACLLAFLFSLPLCLQIEHELGGVIIPLHLSQRQGTEAHLRARVDRVRVQGQTHPARSQAENRPGNQRRRNLDHNRGVHRGDRRGKAQGNPVRCSEGAGGVGRVLGKQESNEKQRTKIVEMFSKCFLFFPPYVRVISCSVLMWATAHRLAKRLRSNARGARGVLALGYAFERTASTSIALWMSIHSRR